MLITTKKLKYQGLGTLKKGQPQEYIYRGEGVTIVIYQDGIFHTMFQTGEGSDLAIQVGC